MSVEAPSFPADLPVDHPADGVAAPGGRGAERPGPRLVDQRERIAAARLALQRAETAAGIRTRLTGPTALRPAGSHVPAGLDAPAGPHGAAGVDEPAGSYGVAVPGTAAGAHVPAVRDAGEAPLALNGVLRAEHAPTAEGHPSGIGGDHFAVPRALLPLFPGGGLRRGSVVQVAGSTSLLLALAAAAAQDGVWSALAAMPDVGLEAAAEAGLALERVVMVPRPGPDAPAVLGALVDGFDVLVVGDCRALSDRDRRLILSRLRTREAVLLSTRPWPGSDLVLEAEHVLDAGRLPGVGNGPALADAVTGAGALAGAEAPGPLRRQELVVHARGRGIGGRGGQVRVSIGVGGLDAVPARGLERVPNDSLHVVGAGRRGAERLPELRAV